MVNPIKMGIIEMVIIKIMDIGKEEIWSGHQRNDCPLWKQHLEHDNKNS
jgi:hypothetical protein